MTCRSPKTRRSCRLRGGRFGRRAASDRTGAILSIELLIVMPLVIAVSLAILQIIAISTVNQRLQAATLAAADAAAHGRPIREVHDAARLVLGPFGRLVRTEIEYFDFEASEAGKNKKKDNNKKDKKDGPPGKAGWANSPQDYVVVAVTIPMAVAFQDYLGLLGGSVKPLHLRVIVKKPIPPGVAFELPSAGRRQFK